MIEVLSGFPPGVLALAGRGRITGRDYQEVLEPAVEAALRQTDKLRLYYYLGADFDGFDAGAMWEDAKTGLEHLARWDRIAVVTDVGWIAHGVRAFTFLMPARVKVFALAEAEAARAWIGEAAA